MPPTLRPARLDDIAAMHRLRLAVRENCLPADGDIDEDSYGPFVTDGAAWVALRGGRLLGFAALDRRTRTVWALFVDPDVEGQGVGSALHGQMLAWAAGAGIGSLQLTTQVGSRAESFYRSAGWRDAGPSPQGDRRFELALDGRAGDGDGGE